MYFVKGNDIPIPAAAALEPLAEVDSLPFVPVVPPASPDPDAPTPLPDGMPSVPVAAEPERVLEEVPEVLMVDMVLMELIAALEEDDWACSSSH